MRLVLPLCLALAACSAEESFSNTFNAQARADAEVAKERVADNRAVDAGFAPDQPAPLENAVAVDAPATPAPGAMLPPATAEYRYIGLWAVSPRLCKDGGWLFQSRKLTVAGGTSCDLPDVGTTQAGYELRGRCHAAGRKTPETIRLTFDEGRKRMRIEGRTLGPADLLYCGP